MMAEDNFGSDSHLHKLKQFTIMFMCTSAFFLLNYYFSRIELIKFGI